MKTVKAIVGIVFIAAVVLGNTHSVVSGPVVLDSRDYTLTVTSAQGGNPTPTVGPHTYAWQSTVTASVDAVAGNYLCIGWTGTGDISANGSTNTTGPVTLNTLTSSIAWQWEDSDPDADHDGMPTDWETQYFGPSGAQPDDDADGDGQSNREEYHRWI